LILAPGARLGRYEILSALGAGGMGEVYRARDPQLDRIVVVKVLLDPFSTRFEREARASAQLNHPHICTLYDVGPNYLVMELVEGETLASRLEKGPLPLDQTLRYGAQLAEALSAAHAKGVVHRDLKPANIMVTKSGVKVLDFGLAKLHSHPGDTITASRVVMGTPAYMAPEQFDGKECDARTDIFALGLALYEMATGKRAMAAHGQSPSMDNLPPQFAHVIERCLAREPENRWQSASDVKAELEWAGKIQPAIAPAVTTKRTPRWMWAAAVLFAGLIAASLWLPRRETVPSETPSEFSLSFENQMAGADPYAFPVPSPDGRHIVFVGGSVGAPTSLWIRALDAVESKPLAGTEHASTPVWSPDSRWIAFYVAGKVKKISPSGGLPQTIADVPGFQDAAWSPQGDLIFRTDNRTALFRIRESGGPIEQVTKLDQSLAENSHRGPVFLAGGRKFLFTSRCGQRENNALYIGSLDSSAVKRLMPVQSIVRYVRSSNGEPGTILYYRDGGLAARRFNSSTEEVSGDPIPVVDNVGYDAAGLVISFNSSNDGRVAVLRRIGGGRTRFTWFNRSGEMTGTLGDPGDYLEPRISPDGTRVAFTRPDPQTGNRDVWFIEIARAIASRLTIHAANDWFPVWSPDGRQLLFGSDRAGGTAMRMFLKKALDAASEESPMSDAASNPYDWSRDGKWITYHTYDVMVASAIDPSKKFAFLATPFQEGGARFSPDGKWIAYASNETGRWEVYVRPFAGAPADPQGKIQISNAGGDFPVWRPDGQELYYMSSDYSLYAVSTAGLGGSAPMPLPSRLFRGCPGTLPTSLPMIGSLFGYNFDTHDGKQFLVNCAVEPPGRFVVLLNWPLTNN
jgi:serine/threonine protein kinase